MKSHVIVHSLFVMIYIQMGKGHESSSSSGGGGGSSESSPVLTTTIMSSPPITTTRSFVGSPFGGYGGEMPMASTTTFGMASPPYPFGAMTGFPGMTGGAFPRMGMPGFGAGGFGAMGSFGMNPFAGFGGGMRAFGGYPMGFGGFGGGFGMGAPFGGFMG